MGQACAPVESDDEDEETQPLDDKMGTIDDEEVVYLYVEYPVSIPFEKFPWSDANPRMKQYDGLISKTWLSGLDNNTVGGFYEFDNRDNAQNYIDNHLIALGKQLGVEGTYKMYSKSATKNASIGMNSPYWKSRRK